MTVDDARSLNQRALDAAREGRPGAALALLEHASRDYPQDFATHFNLGSVREAAGDFAGARDAFQAAVGIDPARFTARLQLGHALERLGCERDALLAYNRAIADAQKQGHWHNKATTPGEILDRVRHAMRFVTAGRRAVFETILAPAIARYGQAELRRVDDCLAVHLGERRSAPADPRQQPSFLFFPGLETAPYFDHARFAWMPELESAWAAIRAELLDVMPESEHRERVFLSDTEENRGLRSSHGAPSWDGYYFYRHGERREPNHVRCPRTSAALASLPLVHIREHAPEVMFSVLTPGSHILPHRGVTNTRVVCHLPLVVPAGCALVVGGEKHVWSEGRGVVFDDTYEHEAWNRGAETRVVLIMDIWNPELTAAERDALTLLIGAIGDFNREAAA